MKKFFLIFLFILIIPFVSADSSYTNWGGNDQIYRSTADGVFNSGLLEEDLTYTTRGVADPYGLPVIADLNNDTVNEIAVLSANNLYIYHGTTLVFDQSIAMAGVANFSNMVVTDFDDDGFNEIVVFQEHNTGWFHVINYNSSHIWNDSSLLALTLYTGGEAQLGCDGDRCWLVFPDDEEAMNTRRYYGIIINETSPPVKGSNQLQIDAVTGAGGSDVLFCSPRNRGVVFTATGNAVFTYAKFEEGGAGIMHGIQLSYDSATATLSELYDYSVTIPHWNDAIDTVGGGDFCDEDLEGTQINALFTQPIVYDYSNSPGEEILFGFMNSQETFEIYAYDDTSTTYLNQHPGLTSGEGEIVGNLFVANVMGGPSGKNNVCLMGQDKVERTVQVVCGSDGGYTSSGFTYDSMDFTYDMPNNYYNLSSGIMTLTHTTHAVNYENIEKVVGSGVSANDIDEILTSWGVFEFDTDNCLLAACDMDIIWSNPLDENSPIPIDYEIIDKDDILTFTSTNLWYIDDNEANQPATYTYVLDPCRDGTWKTNITPTVLITPTDPDNDNVQARIIAYKDAVNEQDTEWQTASDSGTSFLLSFEANTTATNAQLQITARDVINNETTNTTLTYTVKDNGLLEVGDCSETGESVPVVNATVVGTVCTTNAQCGLGFVCFENTCQAVPTTSEDSLRGFFDELAFLSGISKLMLFLIVFMFINFMVIKKTHDSSNAMIFSLVMMNIAWLMLSWFIGIVSTTILITILAVVILSSLAILATKFVGGGD